MENNWFSTIETKQHPFTIRSLQNGGKYYTAINHKENKRAQTTLEVQFALELWKRDIEFTAQPFKILVDKGFNTPLGEYLAMYYTPDYFIPKENLIVEIKGFIPASNMLRYRFVHKGVLAMKYNFIILLAWGRVSQGTKGWYSHFDLRNKRSVIKTNKSINSIKKLEWFNNVWNKYKVLEERDIKDERTKRQPKNRKV